MRCRRGRRRRRRQGVVSAQGRDWLAGIGVPDARGLVEEAVTMREPSGQKAAEVYDGPPCPRRTAIGSPVVASQMRAVLSSDAVTMRPPSGLKAAE